jgi:hypothetical protein
MSSKTQSTDDALKEIQAELAELKRLLRQLTEKNTAEEETEN